MTRVEVMFIALLFASPAKAESQSSQPEVARSFGCAAVLSESGDGEERSADVCGYLMKVPIESSRVGEVLIFIVRDRASRLFVWKYQLFSRRTIDAPLEAVIDRIRVYADRERIVLFELLNGELWVYVSQLPSDSIKDARSQIAPKLAKQSRKIFLGPGLDLARRIQWPKQLISPLLFKGDSAAAIGRLRWIGFSRADSGWLLSIKGVTKCDLRINDKFVIEEALVEGDRV